MFKEGKDVPQKWRKEESNKEPVIEKEYSREEVLRKIRFLPRVSITSEPPESKRMGSAIKDGGLYTICRTRDGEEYYTVVIS